jgi:hypothetical protein
MGYGHAERNLALIRQLETETLGLLETLNQHDPEQTAWLQEVTSQKSGRAGTVAVAGPARSVGVRVRCRWRLRPHRRAGWRRRAASGAAGHR